ncbi:MAG: hypothetical protein MJ252_12215, partial [archaeon]|nr:hypothetical protein [archaeon]
VVIDLKDIEDPNELLALTNYYLNCFIDTKKYRIQCYCLLLLRQVSRKIKAKLIQKEQAYFLLENLYHALAFLDSWENEPLREECLRFKELFE